MLTIDVFPWSRHLEIGIEQIDAQHKLLVALINELCRTVVSEQKQDIVKNLESVANYAEFHFSCEEKYWQKKLGSDIWVSYHSDAHQAFLPSVAKINQDLLTKPVVEVAEDTVHFLIRWLAMHILDEDRKMALLIHYLEQGDSLEKAKSAATNITQNSTKVFTNTLLSMYRSLSSQTLEVLKEREHRLAAEQELMVANKELVRLNKILTEQANIDGLTHIGNRRSFERCAQNEFKRCQREQVSFTLMLWDIDHFKLINDSYGHAAGDEALKAFSGCLKAHSHRPQDQVYRIGGEEFCFVTSHQSVEQAIHLAEKIRASVEHLGIDNNKSPTHPHMTVSAGVVNLIPSSSEHLEQVLEFADNKLYQAKSQGRNRVVT